MTCPTRFSPQISVVIPTHNRAKLLDTTIASVLESALITSPEQIIVVDDDSHDETEEVARRYAVRYVRVTCHSTSGSRNAGLALAQTAYVTFLDDDDTWLSGNMGGQLAALERRPQAAFAYGMVQCATHELEPLPWIYPSPPLASGFAPEKLHLGYPNIGVVLFRREVVVEAGGFDSRVAYQQDADLMIRIASQHEIVGVETVGMLHRLRAPSKARADYYWANRQVMHWSPRHVGVGWTTRLKLQLDLRRVFYHRFCADAQACAGQGRRRETLECIFRAAWISPPRALRHSPKLASIVWHCVRAPT